ncbi:hypothetical protein HNR23_002992 [Nocardiopsis mwathae]|uniref:Uncharacterized protein n=1 Tax=Nocardiopsis mwathae TaxID=1472723 RepID=A0A7W9YIT6_9ACTN|nr:hypothetical protein [Nocardiopsis mwathae]MBB6172932.1 hypothetical protein [Nocardiopsis mwathae]
MRGPDAGPWPRGRWAAAASGAARIPGAVDDHSRRACGAMPPGRKTATAAAFRHGTQHRRTRPYRSRTYGTVERSERTMSGERACARPHRSATETRRASAGRPNPGDRHRFHPAMSGPPASRVTGLAEQYD